MGAAAWLSFLGAFGGALLGGLATIVVGEGRRRREEDTALPGWCTQIYDWVVDGKISSDAACRMLDERRVTPRWWKFNKGTAARIAAILDELDQAFAPPSPTDDEAADNEVFVLEDGDQT